MSKYSIFALILLFSLSFVFAVPPSAQPEDTVRAFYNYRIRSGLTGDPTEAQLKILRQWLSPRLCAQLEKAGKEREAFVKKYGDSEKPPWCEGDLFSSTFEGPNSFEIAGSGSKNQDALVQVIFS